jgi:SAM-dependent methyltransferase
MDVEAKELIEIDYWRSSSEESPEADSVSNIINKVSDAANFLDCLGRFPAALRGVDRAVELGGGQGWASCLFKRLYPSAHVTATDISPYAIRSIEKWERLWGVKVDRAYDCRSYATREDDSSVDLVFCFASAHHFRKHDATLREISRILKPGGRALYLYEPATPKALHSLAHWRVNRKRPAVPEDVLITSRILELAGRNGLVASVSYHPSVAKRGPFETIYYGVLSRMAPLQKMLPCTANFEFSKPVSFVARSDRPLEALPEI